MKVSSTPTGGKGLWFSSAMASTSSTFPSRTHRAGRVYSSITSSGDQVTW